MTDTTWPNSLSQLTHAHTLIPPREFVRIAPEIYASCLPHPRSLPFLNNLKIRSALFFAHKQHPLNLDLPQEVRSWILQLNSHKWSPIDKTKGHGRIAISQTGMKAALEHILAAPRPILLSGHDNIETCGLVVACLRKLQCWDMSSIEDELQRFISVSLDAMHLRFVNQFCASIPPDYLAAYPEHVQRAYAHFTINPSSQSASILQLPHLPQIADWLWYGASSPMELLGEDEEEVILDGDKLWHPTMHLSVPPGWQQSCEQRGRTPISGSAPNWLSGSDQDAEDLQTPRCASVELSREVEPL